jgi:hypothetical protein
MGIVTDYGQSVQQAPHARIDAASVSRAAACDETKGD